MRPLTILGIETSCDETAAAVLRLDDAGPRVLSDIVLGQAAQHAPYSGVVPEIAARAHVEGLDATIAPAMREAGSRFADLDGVAATAGPGLIGGVMVGLVAGKAIALAHDKPLIAVNHLEGHALSPRLAEAGRDVSVSAAAGVRRALPVHRGAGCRAFIAGSAPRSTMRWAKRSTSSPSCWILAFPAGRWSRSLREKRRCGAVCAAAAVAWPRGLRFLVRWAENRVRARGRAAWRARRAGQGRSLRQLPGGGAGHHRRPHAQRDGAVRSDLGSEGAGWWRRAASPPIWRSGAGSKRWRGSAITILSPRR